jgi:hypothetical protein
LFKQNDMKKQFLLALLVLALFACSKDSSKPLEVNLKNVAGKYYFNYFTRPNGTKFNYNGNCNTKKDTVIFTTGNRIDIIRFADNCSDTFYYDGCSNYYFTGNNISGCSSLLFKSTITNLDAQNLTLKFSSVQQLDFGGNQFNPLPMQPAERTFESVTLTRF